MTLESVVQAITAISAPLVTFVGLASRRRRLRAEIRENLALAEELDKNENLREHTLAPAWIQGRIALDVAKLAGQPLGVPKKPIPKGSLAFALILALSFSAWTYLIVRNGFVWYSVFPGIVAALMFISILGMFTNRQIPANQELPPGATPVRSNTASEHVATMINLAEGDGLDERLSEDGQVGVALRFVRAMREGRIENGLKLTDRNWLQCRIQAWLWNNRDNFGPESALESLTNSLLLNKTPADTWKAFIEAERASFVEVWKSIDVDKLGAAGKRRRLARDFDLVILVPLGDTQGFFVTSATTLSNALTFVMRHDGDRWLVASHLGTAPPVPGWPPAWWTTNDPAVEALPTESSPEEVAEKSGVPTGGSASAGLATPI